jgi:hypothetical protein
MAFDFQLIMGMSATTQTRPLIVFNYGSRTVANHEQGRKTDFPKSTSNPIEI